MYVHIKPNADRGNPERDRCTERRRATRASAELVGVQLLRRRLGSRVFKVILVDSLHGIIDNIGHSHTVIDHQICQLLSVDEDDTRINSIHILPCITAELRCCDEHALPRTVSLKAARELLNTRSANGSFPPLCLQVDRVQTEFVFFDDAIDPAITASAYSLRRVRS